MSTDAKTEVKVAEDCITWPIPATGKEQSVARHSRALLKKYHPTEYAIIANKLDIYLCLELVRIRDAQVARTEQHLRSTTGQAAWEMFLHLVAKYELPTELAAKIRAMAAKITDDPIKMNDPKTNVRAVVKELYMMLLDGAFVKCVGVEGVEAVITTGNKLLKELAKDFRPFGRDRKVLIRMHPFRERLMALINEAKILPPDEGFAPKDEDDHITLINSNVLAGLSEEKWEELCMFLADWDVPFDDLVISRIKRTISDDYPRFSACVMAAIVFELDGTLSKLLQAINAKFGTNAKIVQDGKEEKGAISAHITLYTVNRA